MRTSWPALRAPAFIIVGALGLGSVAAAQTPSLVWTIPGTVNAGGLNNTRFVSDLAVTNPGSVPTLATISFVPANGTTPKQVTLNAGETVVYRNVLDSLWGAQGAGATQVASDLPLLIRARTYNTAASGTFGVALPVFANDRLLSAGDMAHSLWISQSADGSAGYRTNVAVVFPDLGGGSATVTVYDAEGNEVGSQDFDLDSAGFQQFGVGGFAGAVSVARAQVLVTRGRAAGYSVVVDNVTGDSSLFAFEDLPAGHQDVLVNGVARANGRNSTFFRTDGRFFNPGTADATVSVAFHANQNSNLAPLTKTFTVPAGKVRDVVDVLDSLLGLPVGAAGALRFTSDATVAILCRTSNVDPAGLKPGTFGAQQKPTPLLSFLMSADAGAVVTGIREGATFRTNVGFAAGPDGAACSLTLKNASGTPVATAGLSLGAFGWTQPNVADLFPGTPIPEDATLLVRVTSGSVDVFDSSIDNASGDPVVTPIMPFPVDIASSATIGPQGGSIRSADGRFTLLIPSGAISSATSISIASDSSDAPNGVGPAYVLSPAGLSFVKPPIVRLAYGPDDTAGAGAAALSIAFHRPDGWYTATGGLVDPGRRTVSVVPSAVPPPAAGRAAQNVFNPAERWAILHAWQVQPTDASMLMGGTARFSAYYAGKESSATCPILDPYCAEKATSPYAVNVIWYADGARGSSSVGTFSPEEGTATVFTPTCARDYPIPIGFVISDSRFLSSHSAVHGTKLKVFSRRWKLTIAERSTNFCGNTNGKNYSWTSKVVKQFTLQDGGGPVKDFVTISNEQSMQNVSGCSGAGPDGCTSTPGYPWAAQKITAVTATFGQDGIRVDVDWTTMAEKVTETIVCEKVTSTLPAEPGHTGVSAPLLVVRPEGFRTDSLYVQRDDLYLKFSVLPVVDCND